MLTGEDTHRQAVQRLAFELLAAGNIELLKLAMQIFGGHAGEGDGENLLRLDLLLQQPGDPPFHCV